jgi:hypothetical protein
LEVVNRLMSFVLITNFEENKNEVVNI